MKARFGMKRKIINIDRKSATDAAYVHPTVLKERCRSSMAKPGLSEICFAMALAPV